MVVAQIFLKNKLSSINTSYIGLDNISRKAKGISLCIKTWQSWLFVPYIFPSSILMQHDMLNAYPFVNFICLTPLTYHYFFIEIKTYVAFGFLNLSFSTINSKLGRLHITFKYSLAFALPFVLSFMFMIMLKMLSNTFFSTCITSKLCWIRLVDQ